jgi:alpha-N-arabinofuranosidase
MYQVFMGATSYAATTDGPDFAAGVPMVDAAAGRGKDGKLYLSLVNTDPSKSAHVVTNLTGTAHGRILTGPAMDSHNSFDAPNAVHPVAFSGASDGGKLSFDLPPRSVAVVAIE